MEKVDMLKNVVDNLTEQVEKLEIRKSNLEAQIHQKTVFLEGQGRIDEVAARNKYYEAEQGLKVLEDNIEEKKRDLRLMEEKFQERMVMLEKREQATLDLEKIRMALSQERSNFNKYKYDTELELEKAKVTIEEAALAMGAVDNEKANFKAREKEISRKELYLDGEIGKLEQDKRDFEIYKQNVLGQEVINA